MLIRLFLDESLEAGKCSHLTLEFLPRTVNRSRSLRWTSQRTATTSRRFGSC